MKKAYIFGATGLVGQKLLQNLLHEDYYTKIIVFTRRTLGVSHQKLTEYQVDFEKLKQQSQLFTPGDYYCCLGTTRKKAGSRQNFKRVDLDYPVMIGKMAKAAGAERFIVISSIGTKAGAPGLYLQTKHSMETALQQLGFSKLSIVRPSLLIGDRQERRPAEAIGGVLYKLASPLMIGKLRKYRAIEAADVAKAMFKIAQTEKPQMVYESDELQNLADSQ